MLGWLLLLFITVPIVEIYLLIRVGAVLGANLTILLIFSTGAMGWWLVRRQGLMTLQLIQADLAAGRLPTERIFSGLLILVGGVLLLTPGIATDAFGFALMVPGNRRLLIRYLKIYFQKKIDRGDNQFMFFKTPDDREL